MESIQIKVSSSYNGCGCYTHASWLEIWLDGWLYLGAASRTTVNQVSDIAGPEGLVNAVVFSPRSGKDLINVAKKMTNIIPITEDARLQLKYKIFVGKVDTILADVS